MGDVHAMAMGDVCKVAVERWLCVMRVWYYG